MSTFKCKMCGGTLEIQPGQTVAECEYCGTQQTLPKLDDDRRANLYDRANHFRRSNEFDKAMGIYENILNEDNTDAEAYWSLVLCRYGIEYVEDPATHKRVPTVNRAQFTSIFDDDNYKSALQYADSYQRGIYEDEARAINEIQKGILAISQKEEPFDVFICYKETDNNGRRTPDSVLANDLYHQLTQEGFKVFFSRITLEDKLGSAYEPYIFAALNSARVMVVLGTKPEYFNAVWVKNEWSRYLALIKQGQKKLLIPAYKDMDPYDLPEEFSHLQAQDMGKLGFMQDLIRGITKIAQADEPQTTVVKEATATGGNAHSAPLLKRAFMFLEDGDWNSADEYCEKVLDIDPENAQAYLGKLMADLHVCAQEGLKDKKEPFSDNGNYQKILRFGDEELKTTLEGYAEAARKNAIYVDAEDEMEAAETEEACEYAIELFATIPGWLDADEKIGACRKKIEQIKEKAEADRKDAIYIDATVMANTSIADTTLHVRHIAKLKKAITLFDSISGWKDADEKLRDCQQKIEELEAQVEAERLKREREREMARQNDERIARRNKKIAKIAIITVAIACAIIAFLFVLDAVIISVGDQVIFGVYEQDNDASNGKEDIEWLVLDKQDGKILVISKYALDCQPYNTAETDVTWETCSLREWLNSDFVNAAFSADEKAKISTVTVSADQNPEYSTDPGNDTQDKVFLLSIPEANKYFDSNDARQCEPTAYAVANGAYKSERCNWWLRSPAKNSTIAGGVGAAGIVGVRYGYRVDSKSIAVRPVLWINQNA